MYSIQRVSRSSQAPHKVRRPGLALKGFSLAVFCFFIELTVIVAASFAGGLAYHRLVYGMIGDLGNYAGVGILAALAYAGATLYREQLGLRRLVGGKRRLGRIWGNWNYALLALVVVAFLTKTTAIYSRGALLAFYVAGLGGLLIVQWLTAQVVMAALSSGHVTPRRVMLVGTAKDFCDLNTGVSGDWLGAKIVHPEPLPGRREGGEAYARALRRLAAKARKLQVDDVVILAPWSQPDRIDQCAEAFSMLPVSIHLGAGRLLDRFAKVTTRRIGAISALSLSEPPMAPLQAAIKRAGDITASVLGLIALSPLFVIVAYLIKRDSPGKVFFIQDRLGFNQRRFRIIKFRTMTATDNGNVIVQAKPGDARITRIGAALRKTNIDELPQLLNVLKGEMSIVGPRPHAVAHDRDFEKRILRYPRRLNVRPGITGWAQVNGHRGETETDAKMERRLEHDLYYIDHWSIGLDFYILLRTFSPTAFRNAR